MNQPGRRATPPHERRSGQTVGKRQRTGAVQDADALSRGPRSWSAPVLWRFTLRVQGFHARIIRRILTPGVGFLYTFTKRHFYRDDYALKGKHEKSTFPSPYILIAPRAFGGFDLADRVSPVETTSNSNPKLPYPDCFHFSAAEGWLYLGDPVAAHLELDRINPALFLDRNVLILRWYIYAKARKWDSALAIAEALVQSQPADPRGWLCMCKTLKSMRRSVEQAYNLASSKTREFPDNWELHYDAACYACLLDRRAEAEFFLSVAMQLGGTQKVARLALKDSDLQGLWKKLKSLSHIETEF